MSIHTKIQSDTQSHESGSRREQASALLRAYPDLSDTNLQELMMAYRQLSPVDRAYIHSDDELSERLAAFREVHRKEMASPFRDYAVLLGIVAVGFVLVVYGVLFGFA